MRAVHAVLFALCPTLLTVIAEQPDVWAKPPAKPAPTAPSAAPAATQKPLSAADIAPSPEPAIPTFVQLSVKREDVTLTCPASAKQVTDDDLVCCRAASKSKEGIPTKEGPSVWFHPSGKVRGFGEYKDNKKTGVWVEYFESGKKKSVIAYKQGEYDGLYISYWENGKRQSEIEYKAGKKNGNAKSWGDDAKPLTLKKFAQDKLIGGTAFAPDGQTMPLNP